MRTLAEVEQPEQKKKKPSSVSYLSIVNKNVYFIGNIYFSDLACFVVAPEQNRRHTGIKVSVSAWLQCHHFSSSEDRVTATSYQMDGVLSIAEEKSRKKGELCSLKVTQEAHNNRQISIHLCPVEQSKHQIGCNLGTNKSKFTLLCFSKKHR